MKQYIKEGKIKYRNQIIVHKNGKLIINPTEEMILEDGWIEYIVPVYEETIEDVKAHKRREIKYYDQSKEVNCFYVNDMPIWLDKATRSGLMLRFQAEITSGLTETTLWYEGIEFPLVTEQAVKMLYAIELYASKCYDVTQKHLAEINKLETKEDVESYDYRKDYPEKLNF